MLARRIPSTTKSTRFGFTLLELMVVMSIIALLVSLILPAIQNSRGTARRVQCLSQMRNVGMAMHNYATIHDGRLPYLRGEFPINVGTSADPDLRTAPWNVHLLPYVEQAALWKRIQTSNNDNPTDPNSTDSLMATNIQVYTCPDDPQSYAPGTLSVIANAGYVTAGLSET